jgi:hypothetical protein
MGRSSIISDETFISLSLTLTKMPVFRIPDRRDIINVNLYDSEETFESLNLKGGQLPVPDGCPIC